MNQSALLRYDSHSIEKIVPMSNGFIRILGTIANVGWLTYRSPDGTVSKEYVGPDVLFEEEHLDSIKGTSLTLNHPPEVISPDNYSVYNKGSIGTIPIKEEKKGELRYEIIVCDKEAIASVKEKKTVDLSMGYYAEVEPIKGTKEFRQTKRICNHIALVERGRAEKAKLLHLDHYVLLGKNDNSLEQEKQKSPAPTLTVIF